MNSSKVCEVGHETGTNRSTDTSGSQLYFRSPTITTDDSGFDMANIAGEEEAPAQTAKDPPTGLLPRPRAPTVTIDDNVLDMAGVVDKEEALAQPAKRPPTRRRRSRRYPPGHASTFGPAAAMAGIIAGSVAAGWSPIEFRREREVGRERPTNSSIINQTSAAKRPVSVDKSEDAVPDSSTSPPSPSPSYVEPERMSSASSRASCGYTSGGSSLVSFSQGHSHKLFFESESIHLEALRPDPGYEEDFEVENNPFAFSPGQLNKLMNPKSLAALKALGGLKGLEKGLRTNRKLGLSIGETILSGCVSFEQAVGETLPFETQKCDDNHIGESLSNEAHSELFRDRKRVFKDNRLPRRPLKSFERCIWKNIIDPLYVLLLVPAVVCFALGMSRREQTYRMGEDLNDGTWQQALTVVAFIVAVVFAESGLGWVTERRRLKSQPLHDHMVRVLRSGRSREISLFEVCVGDLLHLEPGDVVPVDGVLIDGYGVRCDEASATGESDLQTKTPADEVMQSLENGTGYPHLDPFILSGAIVAEGIGVCLVTAVGVHSSLGKLLMSLGLKSDETPLTEQVMKFVRMVRKASSLLALICFVALSIRFAVKVSTRDKLLQPVHKAQALFWNILTATTIAVMAPSMSTAAIMQCASETAGAKGVKDGHVTRNPAAREKLTSITTVCAHIDNFVQEDCPVVAGWVFSGAMPVGFDTLGEQKEPSPTEQSSVPSADSPTVSQLFHRVPVGEFRGLLRDEITSLVVESIAVNTTAFEAPDAETPNFVGRKTEIALLTFAKNFLGMEDIGQERANRKGSKARNFTIPVGGGLTTTLIQISGATYRLHVYGNARALVQYCTRTNGDGSSGTSEDIATNVAEMASATAILQTQYPHPMRLIGIAYRDFSEASLSALDGFHCAEVSRLMEEMTLLAIIGVHTPLRLDAFSGVLACQKSGVSVRLLCDEDIKYAGIVAKGCGIYTDDGIMMEGAVFGNLSNDESVRILPRTQVLAAASPREKVLMITRLKREGEVVAVVGGSYEDILPLSAGNVGICLDVGATEAAKARCDILLTNNSFSSCLTAIYWGRSITAFIWRIIRLRSTPIISAMALVFISAIVSPYNKAMLSAPQVLWIRLISDTFIATSAILDLRATPGSDREIRNRRRETYFTWTMTLSQATFQLTACLILYYASPSIFGDAPNQKPTPNTLVFNTLVWMQVFNLLNNRSSAEYNVFNGLHHILPLAAFMVPSILVIGCQVTIINVGDVAFDVVRPDGLRWAVSVGIAALTIPVGSLARLLSFDLQTWRFPLGVQDIWKFMCSWGPSETQRRRIRTHQPLAVAAVISSTLAAGIAGIPGHTYRYRRHISLKRIWSRITWSWVPLAESLHNIALTFYVIYVGGIRSEALADTGAAVNLVSLDFITRNSGDWVVHDQVHRLAIGDGKTISSLGNIKAEIRFEDSEAPHMATLYIVNGFPFDVALGHDFLKATETIQFSRPGAIKRAGLYRGDQARSANAVILANLVAVRKPPLTTRLWRCLGRERKVVSPVNDSPAILDALNLRKGEIDQRKLFVTTNRNHSKSPVAGLDDIHVPHARSDEISFTIV